MSDTSSERKHYEYIGRTVMQLSNEIDALNNENAKLRELARKMWKPFCWAQSGYEVCLSDEEDREIRDIARELGIEV